MTGDACPRPSEKTDGLRSLRPSLHRTTPPHGAHPTPPRAVRPSRTCSHHSRKDTSDSYSISKKMRGIMHHRAFWTFDCSRCQNRDTAHWDGGGAVVLYLRHGQGFHPDLGSVGRGPTHKKVSGPFVRWSLAVGPVTLRYTHTWFYSSLRGPPFSMVRWCEVTFITCKVTSYQIVYFGPSGTQGCRPGRASGPGDDLFVLQDVFAPLLGFFTLRCRHPNLARNLFGWDAAKNLPIYTIRSQLNQWKRLD